MWALFAFSQEEEKEEIEEKAPSTFALRAGLDMIKLGRTQFEEGYQGVEIVCDLRLNRRLAVAAEVGSEQRTQQTEQINFTTNGSCIKSLITTFNNWKGMDNVYLLDLGYEESAPHCEQLYPLCLESIFSSNY